MAVKTVKGFGIRNQDRRRIRGDLSGEYEGRTWFIQSEGGGLFRWAIGKMAGFAGPTLADVLRTLKKASRQQTKLEAEYGELDSQKLSLLETLQKWERRALQDRLVVTGPHGKGDNSYFKVSIKEAL